ncbi:MAG: hypothetical protein ABJG15_07655, partial [Hyphomonadaceae bacterium]
MSAIGASGGLAGRGQQFSFRLAGDADVPVRRCVSDPALATVADRVRQSLAQRLILGAQAHDPVSCHGADVFMVQLVTHQHPHLP